MAVQLAVFSVISIMLLSTLPTADLSPLPYNRFGSLTTRLQRQEAIQTPYPAAGYRPSEPFDFPSPDKQQFFPTQPQPAAQPQPEVSGFDLEATPNLGSNGDNIDAPSGLYEAPLHFRQNQATRQQFAFSRQKFSSTSSQRSRLPHNFQQTFQATKPRPLYDAPEDNTQAFTRQRQQFATAQQSFTQAPQRLYHAPAGDEPQAERLTSVVKSERLTAAQPEQQREEREDEDEVATDIEVNEVEKPTTSRTPAAAASTPTTSVFYYPAGAIGFVHPITAGYYQPSAFVSAVGQPAPAVSPAVVTTVAPTNAERPAATAVASPEANATPARVTASVAQTSIPAIAPVAAPQYFAASPYLQQYTFANPAQLQAW